MVLMALGSTLLATGVTDAAAPAKVVLSAQDQRSIGTSSCGASGLESATARKVGKLMVASVRCRPHGKEGEVPLARVTSCDKKSSAWTCAPARDALMLKMPDDSVLALVSEGVRSAEAIQTVNTVADLSVPPFQGGAIEVLQNQCSIRQLPEKAFKGATHFSVDCTAGTLAVTRDCWSGKCRFFITNATRRE
jgi:hypothetical protein